MKPSVIAALTAGALFLLGVNSALLIMRVVQANGSHTVTTIDVPGCVR